MDAVSVLIEVLKEKDVITPLEQDILDTYNELNKKPFDREAVIRQCKKNNINHPDISIRDIHESHYGIYTMVGCIKRRCIL